MPNEIALNSLKTALEETGIETVHVFSTDHYGPFKFLNELSPSIKGEHDKLLSKFKDNVYAIAKPKTEFIEIYQIDETSPLTIYRPFRFLIGRVNIQEKKSCFVVYVPNQYLKELKNINKFEEHPHLKMECLTIAAIAHNKFYSEFFNRLQEESQKFLDEYFLKTNLRELALNGNRKLNVPIEIIEAIKNNKISSGDKSLPIGQFILHEEEIELPNSQIKTITLNVITKFNGSNSNNYTENDCHITETTENYSILYKLISK